MPIQNRQRPKDPSRKSRVSAHFDGSHEPEFKPKYPYWLVGPGVRHWSWRYSNSASGGHWEGHQKLSLPHARSEHVAFNRVVKRKIHGPKALILSSPQRYGCGHTGKPYLCTETGSTETGAELTELVARRTTLTLCAWFMTIVLTWPLRIQLQ
jgi:hypothetical protein